MSLPKGFKSVQTKPEDYWDVVQALSIAWEALEHQSKQPPGIYLQDLIVNAVRLIEELGKESK